MSIVFPRDYKNKMEKATLCREGVRKEHYSSLENKFGRGAARAMEELYSLYDEGLYLWLANLWEPSRGGFYYSNSARDTEGFGVDVESTAQALSFVSSSGLIDGRGSYYPEAITDSMKEKLLDFALGLQDEEDGYFYHPQWGKRVAPSRRGRDLGWAVSIIRNLGRAPLYPSPLDRVKNDTAPSTLPEYLQDACAFRRYLAEFDLPESKYYHGKNSYGLGNLLQSQAGQIIAAGNEYTKVLFDWLGDRQYDNGLWEEESGYDAVNGLMKMCLIYSAAGAQIPRAERALHETINAIRSTEAPGWVCVFYNPWITASTLLNNITKYGGGESANKYRRIIRENAEEMIMVTKSKIEIFKKADGSFSYYPDRCSPSSQNARVALDNTNEGDVNGSCISSTGVTRNICSALGTETIPLFSREDGDIFFELIETARENRKIRPDPRGEKK